MKTKHTFQIKGSSLGNSKRTPFETLNQVCAAFRAFIEGNDLGASDAGQCLIYDQLGKQVAFVSYNGNVWEGSPRNWKPGVTPVFNPSEAVCAS